MSCQNNILKTNKDVPLLYVVLQKYINNQKPVTLLYDVSQQYINNQ
jgi:hypothetical protein